MSRGGIELCLVNREVTDYIVVDKVIEVETIGHDFWAAECAASARTKKMDSTLYVRLRQPGKRSTKP